MGKKIKYVSENAVSLRMPPGGQGDGHERVRLTRHWLRPKDEAAAQAMDPRLLLCVEPDSERAARFRVLRHHLLAHARPQVIVVSSPDPGEGKTTCAVNLALALAECGRARVLLVEAAVRRPQLARMFGFVPPRCFAEMLAGGAGLAGDGAATEPWEVVDVVDTGLHVAVIDPGGPRGEARRLVDAPGFALAMEQLRMAGYEHIVIDAPAVLGSAEVNLIQDAADGVLLACKARHTTARALRSAVDQLRPATILGTVLFDGDD